MLNWFGLSGVNLFPIALIGFHFAWLLSFPLWGPVLVAISAQRGGDPYTIGLCFVLSSAVGLLLYAFLPNRMKKPSQRKALFATLTAAATTLSFLFVPVRLWCLLSVISGLSSALVIIYWSISFLGGGSYSTRGRSVAFFVILANIILYVALILSRVLSPEIQTWLSLIPLLLTIPILLSEECGIKSFYREPDSSPRKSILSTHSVNLFLFIFAFYFSAGLLMNVVYAGMNVYFPNFATYYSSLPYILATFVAGRQADGRGRRYLPLKAWTFLGIGLASVFLIQNRKSALLLSCILSLVAYGYGDVFLWTHMGDLSSGPVMAPFSYGLGVSTNLIALGAGAIFTNLQSELSPTPVISIGLILLFVTLIPLFKTLDKMEQPMEDDDGKGMAGDADGDYGGECQDIISFFEADLAQRETEILSLLVKGLSNSDIAESLHVAEPTVKTHLRNIYRKTGCPNRRALLSAIISGNLGDKM